MSEQNSLKQTALSRRKALKTIGTATVSLPLFALIGCGSQNNQSSILDTINSSNNSSDDSDNSNTDSSVAWASGGTNLITVDYPATSLFCLDGRLCAGLDRKNNRRALLFFSQ